MGNFIIEYIGREGVQTSPADAVRFNNPRSGDAVLIPDGLQGYPFTQGKFARIAAVRGPKIQICCGLGSAFLNVGGSVSISGGPFETLDAVDLEPLGYGEWFDVWNFPNGAGGGMGVNYKIFRPVFRLKRLKHGCPSRRWTCYREGKPDDGDATVYRLANGTIEIDGVEYDRDDFSKLDGATLTHKGGQLEWLAAPR